MMNNDRLSTRKVAEFVAGMTYDQLPARVVSQVKTAIRDNIGVSIRAHRVGAVEATRKVVLAMGGKEESTLIGIGSKVPCNMAAWVNAVMGSTLDMDDGAIDRVGHMGHPGGMVVPVALAVAERENASGKQLIEAVAIGYEVSIRTSAMYGGVELVGRPGAYAAAALSAKLMKLSVDDIANAIAIAEVHSPEVPLDTLMLFPAMTKEGQGWGAMTGVSSVLLAQAGFTGPRTIYDLQSYSKAPWDDIGRKWWIDYVYYKAHSACYCAHSSVDGVQELVKRHNLTPDDIAEVTIGTYQLVLPMGNLSPKDMYEAHYSIPFLVGAAIVYGEAGPDQVNEEKINDPLILEQARKVRLVPDREMEAGGLEYFGAKVSIKTKEGNEYNTLRPWAKGMPQYPMSEEELEGKFRKLTTSVMGAEKSEELLGILNSLESLVNIQPLIAKLGRWE